MNKTTLNSQKEKHSMLSLRRATFRRQRARRGPQHFYPRSPCGERHHLFWYCAPQRNFYPRSPCGERHQATCTQAHYIRYFYPRSPCGERRQQATICIDTAGISIHALLAESDGFQGRQQLIGNISIHALLAESDRRYIPAPPAQSKFLSTLSLRRATKICKYVARRNVISIHALLAESDIYCHLSGASYSISIHALLAESDGPWSTLPIGMANFYPRSPCGERPLYLDTVSALASFLSTLSLRRATSSSGPFQGDQLLFYPRSPCGERRM